MVRSDWTWRYGLNWRAAASYRLDRHRTRKNGAHIAGMLARDGIAVFPAAELFGRDGVCDGLIESAARLESEWTTRLEELREAYRGGSATGKQKPYSIHLLPDDVPNPNDIYARFALQPALLDVVNGYFGMYSTLTQCNVWHNFVAEGAPTQSQLWHRDPEDRHILKVFLCLTDVDEGSGPFTYARGSHRHPFDVAPHSRLDGETPRSTDEELARLVPPERWLTAVGPKGTLVIADTRGYHKGGRASRSERIVYVSEYLCSSAHGIPTRDYHRRAAAGALKNPADRKTAATNP